MKKLICLLNHPLRLAKTTDYNIEDFENENREVRVYKCKYCGKDILVRERCIKGKFCKPFNHSKDFKCENYLNGYCDLDNEVCYVKKNNKDTKLSFDCIKKLY